MFLRIPWRLVAVSTLVMLIAPRIGAEPIHGQAMLQSALDQFTGTPPQPVVLEAAKNLFQALASMSLVWTMGLYIMRQDIGEMMMELLRFIVVTGTFYWLLINASGESGQGGFVGDIVASFFQIANDGSSGEAIRNNAGNLLSKGLNVFYTLISATGDANTGDAVIGGILGILILSVCALMAAQFLVALVMAWLLSYAGIFLLGFGGSRWTSGIAISFYKHVLALGVVLLTLHFIGTAASNLLNEYDHADMGMGTRSADQFGYAGGLLAAVILMMVLSIKLPQLIYTLVTGSPLGMFTGTATMAGHAFVTGGGAAWSSATAALPPGGGNGSTGSARTDTVMDAVQRSAASAGAMNDPFHVSSGSDPFGVRRAPDPHRHFRRGGAFADAPATSEQDPVADRRSFGESE
jgi:type IV secretion system protein VirB6/type IV secretion system protein TrbL